MPNIQSIWLWRERLLDTVRINWAAKLTWINFPVCASNKGFIKCMLIGCAKKLDILFEKLKYTQNLRVSLGKSCPIAPEWPHCSDHLPEFPFSPPLPQPPPLTLVQYHGNWCTPPPPSLTTFRAFEVVWRHVFEHDSFTMCSVIQQ